MANPSPLRYPGGKYKTFNYVKELVKINNCSTYIEPFSGGAAVALDLLIKGHVKKIILNDFDRSIYALWHSILYETEDLLKLLKNTSVTIDEWHTQKEIQNTKKHADLLTLGFSTLFLNRTNRSGIIKAGVMGGKNQKGKYRLDCRFNKDKLAEKIRTISCLEKNIELYNMDALDLIEKVIVKTRKSFTFFDPPYFEKGPSLYTDFYQQADHVQLSNKISNLLNNRHWIVTYDVNKEIKKMYEPYFHLKYFLNYSAQNKTQGTEYMFFSKKTFKTNPDQYLKLVG